MPRTVEERCPLYMEDTSRTSPTSSTRGPLPGTVATPRPPTPAQNDGEWVGWWKRRRPRLDGYARPDVFKKCRGPEPPTCRRDRGASGIGADRPQSRGKTREEDTSIAVANRIRGPLRLLPVTPSPRSCLPAPVRTVRSRAMRAARDGPRTTSAPAGQTRQCFRADS